MPRVLLAGLLLLVGVACSAPAPPASTPAPSVAASPSPVPRGVPSPSPGLAVSPSPSPSPVQAPSPLPEAVAGPLELDPFPFAAMIDNIAEARPQTGLGEADVVYEAPAEGGIPRLMPVYLRQGVDVARIGPVRSARPYFVDLANEYPAPIVHIGYSPQALQALRDTGLPDLDEIRGDAGFTRDPRRQAPHNAYVSTSSVRQELQAHGVKVQPTLGPLVFGAYHPGADPATQIKILYPGGERYRLEYDFDDESRTYLRSMDGQPHRDGDTGQQYAARSVIVEYVPVTPIPNDDAGRLDVEVLGNGRATLFVDGTGAPLTWSRATLRAATQFRRTDGAPFALPQGQVWIQIVPLETSVDVS